VLALPPPTVEPFCTLRVELAPIMDLGLGRFAQRRIVPIVGGQVTGRITGTILGVGADWQSVTHDGVAELHARYAFETPEGALVEVVNTGYRHGPPEVMRRLAAGEPTPPASYSMRSTARLESGHPDYRWLNRMVFVGTGARDVSTVQVDLYSVG